MHGTLIKTPDANLDALASTIKQAHAKSQQAAGAALEHAIAAGHALNQAKAQIKQAKSGRWLPWLRDHVGIPERTANLYMRLASHAAEVLSKSATVADFGVREAAKMLVTTWGREPINAPVLAAGIGPNSATIQDAARLYIADHAVVADVTFGRGAFWTETDTQPVQAIEIRSQPGQPRYQTRRPAAAAL